MSRGNFIFFGTPAAAAAYRSKKAIPKDQALQIIYDEAGTHFDPDIIRILKGIEEKAGVQAGKETA